MIQNPRNESAIRPRQNQDQRDGSIDCTSDPPEARPQAWKPKGSKPYRQRMVSDVRLYSPRRLVRRDREAVDVELVK